MTSINRALMGVIGMLISLPGTVVPAAAQTSITTCGFVISAPGNYVVNADLLNCTSDGIVINASQVSVKLNGHKMTSTVSLNRFGINIHANIEGARLNHVGIEGPGLIQGFGAGIDIHDADYCQVALVTATQSSGGFGLFAESVTYLTVGSNVFVANGIGASLEISSNGVISYNDLSGNTDTGLALLMGGNANTVNNNIVSGVALHDGIRIQANGSRVYSNVTNGNGEAGIHILGGSSANQIFNNSSSVGNGGNDLQDDNVCGSNFWSNNVFFTSNPSSCVH